MRKLVAVKWSKGHCALLCARSGPSVAPEDSYTQDLQTGSSHLLYAVCERRCERRAPKAVRRDKRERSVRCEFMTADSGSCKRWL